MQVVAAKPLAGAGVPQSAHLDKRLWSADAIVVAVAMRAAGQAAMAEEHLLGMQATHAAEGLLALEALQPAQNVGVVAAAVEVPLQHLELHMLAQCRSRRSCPTPVPASWP